jgi:thiamine-monophosphate kinase
MKMNEFDRIKKYFKPLASLERGSLNLSDDAALLPVQDFSKLIISTDALVQGIHFIGDESADLIGQKCLRANLSDMAAMGATPWAYTLSLILGSTPKNSPESWLKSFVVGLAKDQDTYDVRLVGGDSVVGFGPTMISITILGKTNKNGVLRRDAAGNNDDIYVSGTVGDSAVGLQIIKGSIKCLDNIDQGYLIDRYRLPQPRVELGVALVGVASAAMDISDGLVQDIGHICSESGLAARINWPSIPLSKSIKLLVDNQKVPISLVMNGGDDYELLFTAPIKLRGSIEKISRDTKTLITRIGRMAAGSNVLVLDNDERPIASMGTGFRHA